MKALVIVLLVVLFLSSTSLGLEIKVGLIVNSAGIFNERDTLILQGVELWAKSINDSGGLLLANDTYNITIIIEDGYSPVSDLGNIEPATQLLCVNHSVDFIVSPFHSSRVEASSEIADFYGIPYFSSAGLSTYLFQRNYSYFFFPASRGDQLNHDVIDFIIEKGLKSIAILYKLNDTTSATTSVDVKQYLNDTNVALEIKFVGGYESQVLQDSVLQPKEIIRNRIKLEKPDVFFYTGFSSDLEIIADIFATEKYSPKLAVSGVPLDAVTDGVLRSADKWLATSFYYSTMNYGKTGRYLGTTREYNALFNATYGHTPGVREAFASACCIVWQKGAEKAANTSDWKDPAALRDGIMSLRPDVDDIFFGKLNFSQDGSNPAKPPEIFLVTSKGMVPISAAELTVPTTWPWDEQSMSEVASESSSTRVGLIAGLTIGLFFLVAVVLIVIIVVVVLLLRTKYHFFFLTKD